MLDLIISYLPKIIGGITLLLSGGFLMKKRMEKAAARTQEAEAQGSELDNVEKAVQIWRQLSEDLKKEISEIKKLNESLEEKMSEVLRENRDLKKTISNLKREITELKKKL